MSHRARAIVVLATLGTLLGGRAEATPSARLHVQVPVDVGNPGATRLDSIEGYGDTATFNRDFTVPYDQLTTLIEAEIAKVAKPLDGKIVLTDPVADVTYKIKFKPKFKFTKKNQPKFTQVGPSSDATFDVSLDTAARLDVHIDVHAETWSDSADVPVDVFVTVAAKAKVRVKLWPKIEAEDVDVEFSLSDSNIDLELNGTAVKLGAKWGTVLGVSPVGIFAGGILLGPLAAILANEAADIVEDKLKSEAKKRLAAALDKFSGEVESRVRDEIDPKIAQANAVKDKVMNTPVEGTGKTLSQLVADLGASFEVHVATPGDALAASAVLRMSGAAAGGTLRGKVRVPTQACQYVTGNGWLKGAKIPVGMTPANEDLAKKLGQSCSAVFDATSIARQLYLGGNPRRVLGTEAENRASWKTGGTLDFTGKLSKTDDYYECAFEVTGLPKASILDIESAAALDARLNEETYDERLLVLSAGGATAVFDRFIDPVPGASTNGVVLGGPGQCHGHGGGGKALTPSQAKELLDKFDPEKCPSCGIRQQRGTNIYEVVDMAKFEAAAGVPSLKTAVGRLPSVNAGAARGVR